MEKNDDKNPVKARKSIFNNFLAKRSTRVEPHPFDDDRSVSGQSYRTFEQQSASANSTPIKISKNDRSQSWRRHNSTQHMNNIDAAAERPGASGGASAKESSNRLGHPFSLCCNSSESNAIAPGNSNGMTTATVNAHTRNVVFNDTVDYADDRVISTRVDIHSPIRSAPSSPVTSSNQPPKCLPETTKISDSSPEHENGTSSKPTSPVLSNQLPTKSIAMSACRSRFRDKLLPPGANVMTASVAEQDEQPETASTNHGASRPAPEASSSRKSFSYDRIVKSSNERPNSADSLVKQSLMAAQVLHLIPTEKARERFVVKGYSFRTASLKLIPVFFLLAEATLPII